MSSALSPPIALTIAGSDCSGGAGIQADLKTFAALGVYGASVITALTAQNTRGVTAVHAVSADFITAQCEAVFGDLKVAAIKTGMLGDTLTVQTVVAALARWRAIPLVVDPVMVATSGDVLLAPDAIQSVLSQLIPLATVITPNLHEAAALLDQPVAETIDEMIAQGSALLALGCAAVLIKGGHGKGDTATDVLATADGVELFSQPRIDTRNTHGTGCTLSAAIAAHLAQDASLHDAVRAAKAYVWHALQSAANMKIGHGAGPVDHAFHLRTHRL